MSLWVIIRYLFYYACDIEWGFYEAAFDKISELSRNVEEILHWFE